MKRSPVSLHLSVGSVLIGETITAAVTFATVATGLVPLWAGLAIGATVGLLLCVVRFGDAVVWQWMRRLWRHVGHRAPRQLVVGGVIPGEQTVALPDGTERTVASSAALACSRWSWPARWSGCAGRPPRSSGRRRGRSR